MAQKMDTPRPHKRPIQIGDKTFDSVSQFCRAYDLKYPTVSKQLHKGKTPQEIIDERGSLPVTNRYKDGTKIGKKCSYNGVEYPSLVAAADALGFSVHNIYAQMAARDCSPDDAIRAYMDGDTDTIDSSGSISAPTSAHFRERPVIINGTLYASKAEACRAYGVKFISVVSRMRRDHISFEEALLQGDSIKRKMVPSHNLWDESKFFQVPKPSLGEGTSEYHLYELFKRINRSPQVLYNTEEENYGFQISETLLPLSEERVVYVIINGQKQQTVREMEFFIPDLIVLNTPDAEHELTLLRTINELNTIYIGTQMTLIKNRVQISSMVSVPSSIPQRLTLSNYYRFIGNAMAAFEVLNLLA